MEKGQAIFILVVSFSLCAFSLELETTLAKSPPQSPPKFVAVEGYVYTRPCNHSRRGYPAAGTTVKLECNNNKGIRMQRETNFNGKFLIFADKSITVDKVHNCKVYLVTAPDGRRITNSNGGIRGATLIPQHRTVDGNHDFYLYNIAGKLLVEHICPR